MLNPFIILILAIVVISWIFIYELTGKVSLKIKILASLLIFCAMMFTLIYTTKYQGLAALGVTIFKLSTLFLMFVSIVASFLLHLFNSEKHLVENVTNGFLSSTIGFTLAYNIFLQFKDAVFSY